jgi:Uma2 family endonuclease
MGLPQPIDRCTPEEYLRREQDSLDKHEYYHGEVFAMAGGSPEHSRVIANVIRRLGNKLDGTPCGVFDRNLRVRIPRTILYTYPDVSVVCGPLQFDPLDVRRQTVLNPTLLVEVLSPGTEAWDRGGKFENYQRIDSLREYVLVASETARVETYLRQADGRWLYAAVAGLDAQARLESLGIDLSLADAYAGVTFPAPAAEGPTG